MSRCSTAKLVVGLPLQYVDFKDEYIKELFYGGDELEDIERFISYDAQDFKEQLIGIELSSVDWGYVPIEFDEKWLQAVNRIKEVVNSNHNDIKLYLVSSYF